MHRKGNTTLLGLIICITSLCFIPAYFLEKEMNSKLIGKKAEIKCGYYSGHWGYIRDYDGHRYTITEGSIGDLQPIFDRDEFLVRREQRTANE